MVPAGGVIGCRRPSDPHHKSQARGEAQHAKLKRAEYSRLTHCGSQNFVPVEARRLTETVRQQAIHVTLPLESFGAGCALAQVFADLKRLGVAQLGVEVRAHPASRIAAVHDVTPLTRPFSMASSASCSRNLIRARCTCDITVPTGISIISAISL